MNIDKKWFIALGYITSKNANKDIPLEEFNKQVEDAYKERSKAVDEIPKAKAFDRRKLGI